MRSLITGRLSLGTANAGNLYRSMTDAEANELFEAAWEGGIRYFDTAPHYGLGLSERRLGAFLRTKPREAFSVSTKVGRLLVPDAAGASRRDDAGFDVPASVRRVLDYSEPGIRRSLDESLERLGLEKVDIVYVHDPEQLGTDEALASALPAVGAMKAEGIVDAIGVGSMDHDALTQAVRLAEIDLVMLAGRYTLLEQPALSELVPACEAAGVKIVNTAVFNSGLLASKRPSGATHYDNGAVPPAKLQRARDLAAICAEFTVELPAAALQYCLRDRNVATVLVGAANARQLNENVSRMRAPIPEELWQRLVEAGLIPE